MSTYQVMPRLTAEEYADLEASILAHGVQVPIVVDADGEVIDGHHRLEIAQANGLDCPEIVRDDLTTDDEKIALALTLNVHRRHLTREQRRDLIRISLRAAPDLSDRQHAEMTGADHKTVGSVRNDMQATGEIPQSDRRTGADGRERPASVTVTRSVRTTIPIDEQLASAVERYPFLADYENVDSAISTAAALDATPEGHQRDRRIEAAKTWPKAEAAARERAANPPAPTPYDVAHVALVAIIDAARAVATAGGPPMFADAAADLDVEERTEWLDSVERAISALTDVAAALRPNPLRRVK